MRSTPDRVGRWTPGEPVPDPGRRERRARRASPWSGRRRHRGRPGRDPGRPADGPVPRRRPGTTWSGTVGVGVGVGVGRRRRRRCRVSALRCRLYDHRQGGGGRGLGGGVTAVGGDDAVGAHGKCRRVAARGRRHRKVGAAGECGPVDEIGDGPAEVGSASPNRRWTPAGRG